MARRRVTISFDNGPDPAVTPAVLDLLGRRGVRALFFPVGERLLAPGAMELMRRAAAEGHGIGNHTFSHPRPFGALPLAQAVAEIDRTDALLEGLTEPERMFRPSAGGGVLAPGVLTRGIVDHLAATGHSLVLWSVVAGDWTGGNWVDLAVRLCAEQDHALIALHDIAGGGMADLDRFLDRLEAAGIAVVPDPPAECVPMRRGVVVGRLDGVVG